MDIVNIYKKINLTKPYLYCREIKHRIVFPKQSKMMANAIDRFKKSKSRKSNHQVRKETRLCQQFWRCYPSHYYRYGLYEQNKILSENELLSYVPEFFFYNLFLPFHESKEYYILLDDKNIQEQYLKSLSIAQPNTICKLIGGQIYDCELSEKNLDALSQELRDSCFRKIFIKPANGEGGKGIYIFNKSKNGSYINRNGDKLDEKFLDAIKLNGDWLIQVGVEQSAEISSIYAGAVNTFRIATEMKNGKAQILCTTLRLGRNGMEVDNASQGGIFVKVNLAQGELSDYATSHNLERFSCHPDTNFTFKNYQIKNWNKIKEFVINAAEKLPQLTYLGWDIALTDSGPLVLETNSRFGIDNFQIAVGGLRNILNIEHPVLYWKSN